MNDIATTLGELTTRLANIEMTLNQLLQRDKVKDWYTTTELAVLVCKAEFTVREWCRLGLIHATKKRSGRGRAFEWVISHAELIRIQREGLLPQV